VLNKYPKLAPGNKAANIEQAKIRSSSEALSKVGNRRNNLFRYKIVFLYTDSRRKRDFLHNATANFSAKYCLLFRNLRKPQTRQSILYEI